MATLLFDPLMSAFSIVMKQNSTISSSSANKHKSGHAWRSNTRIFCCNKFYFLVTNKSIYFRKQDDSYFGTGFVS